MPHASLAPHARRLLAHREEPSQPLSSVIRHQSSVSSHQSSIISHQSSVFSAPGGTFPAAVICPAKNRPNSFAASMTARYPAIFACGSKNERVMAARCHAWLTHQDEEAVSARRPCLMLALVVRKAPITIAQQSPSSSHQSSSASQKSPIINEHQSSMAINGHH